MLEKGDEQRNFRYSYYEKVGCRSVEEKKSLEILLASKPLSKLKLKQFSIRFAIPAVHRQLLWNLLLGVAPLYSDSTHYISSQRTIIFQDLHHALELMRIIDEKTPKSRVFYAMFLLERRELYLGCKLDGDCDFVAITSIILQTFDNDVDAYWLAKNFYALTQDIANELPKLIELTITTLEKEDPVIHKHLSAIKVLEELPYERFYVRCFAGILADSALIRIWDKIVGGSIKIVVFVLVGILSTLKRSMLRATDRAEVLEAIENLKDEQQTSDMIVNGAIEFWQQNKGHNEFLVHQSKTKESR